MMIVTSERACRPRLVYSAGFNLVRLDSCDRERLDAHYRSVQALRLSVGRGTMGELCNLPPYAAPMDFDQDSVIAACDPGGGIVATARIHRASRFLSWAELWYTAWPGARAHGACGQAATQAIAWASCRGYAWLVAYAAEDPSAERSMLEQLGFQVSWQDRELIAELALDAAMARS